MTYRDISTQMKTYKGLVNYHHKIGDTLDPLDIDLLDENLNPATGLASATHIYLKLRRENRREYYKMSMTLFDSNTATVRYVWGSDLANEPDSEGIYFGEIEIVTPAGSRSYPKDDEYFIVQLTKRLELN